LFRRDLNEERGRENLGFPGVEVLKPQGFKKRRAREMSRLGHNNKKLLTSRSFLFWKLLFPFDPHDSRRISGNLSNLTGSGSRDFFG
jgi:hypothetical protein